VIDVFRVWIYCEFPSFGNINDTQKVTGIITKSMLGLLYLRPQSMLFRFIMVVLEKL
jgi:hypothetical protein